MNHYQEQYTCSVCKRVLVVDISSIGTGHQSILAILAVTCKDCATNIMKPGEIEEPKFKLTEEGRRLQKEGLLDENGNPLRDKKNALIDKKKHWV